MLTEAAPQSSTPFAPPAPVTLPAGGSDPTCFDWKEVWYPVFYLEDLDKTKPNSFTLLERDLVIWWDRQANCWRAMDDQCPHRLASLSEGRIAEDGLLECPYHGWAFRGDGGCDRIPQQPSGGTAHESPRACVASLPTVERQGLLFVYAGNPENAPQVKVPIIEPMEADPHGWTLFGTFRDLPYDALTLMENVLDASHLPFTHHGNVGKRDNAAPVQLEVLEADRQGFTGTWPEGPRKGTMGRQNTTFIAPGLMWHDLTSKQYGRTLTVVYATPIRKGECRLFARFPFQFSSKLPAFFINLTPRWYSHLGQNAILEDDQIFLHRQERYLAQKGNSQQFAKAFYLPTQADYFVSELRKWVNAYEADPFPNQPFPPAQPPEVLLERYHSHTQQCSSCRQALKTVQTWRRGVAIAAAVSWSLFPIIAFTLAPSLLLVLLLVLLPLMAGAAWLWLGQLEQRFKVGDRTPTRNRKP
jgi:phenylpropionate dioxygenase-like ring-hydroxylating dioxygenase large terminal subunit